MAIPKRVANIDGGYPGYAHEQAVLSELGYRLDVFEGGRHDRAAKLAFARGAVGLFCRWTEVDGELLDALPELRAIVRYGVGYDNIDVAAATARGVRVCNVQGYANHSVSHHALALMLACCRALPLGQRRFRETFGGPPREDIFDFGSRTLGIVGLGRIGGTLSQKARGLFHRVLACDPYVPSERFAAAGAEKAELPTLLAESHVVSLHCNLTDETRGMIGDSAFRLMTKRPILVNTARGPVIDEEALLAALEADRIHSAGLDVFHDEPPLADRDALLSHPRVIATGHYAWYSGEAHLELQRRAGDNMAALLRGEAPEDCLNSAPA
jgi:D-3-phosphoglycerate dehydrogenase / 2-oxoglutarate reductase